MRFSAICSNTFTPLDTSSHHKYEASSVLLHTWLCAYRIQCQTESTNKLQWPFKKVSSQTIWHPASSCLWACEHLFLWIFLLFKQRNFEPMSDNHLMTFGHDRTSSSSCLSYWLSIFKVLCFRTSVLACLTVHQVDDVLTTLNLHKKEFPLAVAERVSMFNSSM